MDETFGETARELNGRVTTGLVLLLGGIVGLAASFDLTYERIASLTDPSHAISCDFNPVLSCGTVMDTDQASVLGFPNPVIGLMAFPFVLFTAVLLLSRVDLPRWILLTFNLGVLGGLGFVSWLIFQSVYRIGVLCPWCMGVWAAVLPIFWFTTVYNLRNGAIRVGQEWRGPVEDLLRYHWIGLTVLYGVIVAIVGMGFWDYWSTLF
ncbi:vitamin K epoxide reductase family protein [Glycomyces sp. L485]|uniref:vitamin K epoxide reductase family protein n=1 Tax=Glycomyces sp. L485 TaxID=2909235 RepID=UPI001F4A2927|nr:vitamin K epoxide reductase family protein [Glycomyces sp. L485]MCH7231677.1 vitamin K epoxide reductase family protein [Glycomyces sp. L485]